MSVEVQQADRVMRLDLWGFAITELG